ncbi:MAG: 30S ribosome-binding factor RbfA [Deltaproteobacteria bacterium]|nr:MAG: 30S ribosome-binding factor RbfA [Deltaproteobacteria bacterium]
MGESGRYQAAVPQTERKRAQRVAQLLQQELGQLLVEGIKDPRIGFVTVTEVRLTDDLRSAQAYVSLLGSEAEQEASLLGLRAASGYLKRELTHRLGLRFAPMLTFAKDVTLAHAQRLEMLLHAARCGLSEAPPLQDEVGLPKAETPREVVAAVPMPAPPPRPQKKARRRRR